MQKRGSRRAGLQAEKKRGVEESQKREEDKEK